MTRDYWDTLHHRRVPGNAILILFFLCIDLFNSIWITNIVSFISMNRFRRRECLRITFFLLWKRCSHFGSSHLSQTLCCLRTRRAWCSLFPSVRRCFMPRRGWSTLEVPDGWLQLIIGPRPKSERWPLRSPQTRQKPAPAVRQSGVQVSKGPA